MPAPTHGKSRDPAFQKEYRVWVHMRERCYNPNTKHYERYGGRGIIVCNRWFKFENFLQDMGRAPHGLTLERRDNDGIYEPGNCYWATQAEQNANKTNPGPEPVKTNAVRAEVMRLSAEGLSTRRIAAQVGIGKSLAHRIVAGLV